MIKIAPVNQLCRQINGFYLKWGVVHTILCSLHLSNHDRQNLWFVLLFILLCEVSVQRERKFEIPKLNIFLVLP